jgi:hypothetical protein
MAVLTGISPVLLVADLQRSIDYFSDRLGFECHMFGDPPNFATAARDAAIILLALSDQPERLVPHWQIVDKMWDAYIRVDDADAMYAEVQERGAGIDYTIYEDRTAFANSASKIPTGTTSLSDSDSALSRSRRVAGLPVRLGVLELGPVLGVVTEHDDCARLVGQLV